MIWTQRGWWNPAYELWEGQQRRGEVEFRQRKWWCRDYDAYATESATPIASYEGSWFRCSAEMIAGGRTYTVTRSLLRRRTEVEDPDGKLLFVISSASWLGRSYDVTFGEGAKLDPQIELLLYFAMFVLTADESDASAAVSV
jgi:hypothetical protein